MTWAAPAAFYLGEAITDANMTIYSLQLRNGARWFKKVKKLRSDMVGVADEFGRQLFNELDYVKEAYNCLRFKVCTAFVAPLPPLFLTRKTTGEA